MKITTHEVSEASTLAESLGVRLNGAAGEVSATPSRDWRLYRAIGALIHGGQAVSGEELQVIVGHITIPSLLNRGLMCVLRHSYVH